MLLYYTHLHTVFDPCSYKIQEQTDVVLGWTALQQKCYRQKHNSNCYAPYKTGPIPPLYWLRALMMSLKFPALAWWWQSTWVRQSVVIFEYPCKFINHSSVEILSLNETYLHTDLHKHLMSMMSVYIQLILFII